MNTVITLVAVAFLGQAEPVKTYPGAPGAYGKGKTEATKLNMTQDKIPSEQAITYDCKIKWVEKGKSYGGGELLAPPGTADYAMHDDPAAPMQSQNAEDAYYGGGFPGPSFVPSEGQTAPDFRSPGGIMSLK